MRRPSGRGTFRSICPRVSSMRRPNGTPAGHAVSHARQPRHRSMWRTKFSVRPMRPSDTARIRYTRPRGESISWPSTRYVGHWGRQMPQCTQSRMPSQSGGSLPSKAPTGRGTACAVSGPAA